MMASLIAQLVKNPPAMQETPAQFLGRKIRWRRDRLPTPVFLGFPCDSAGKNPSHNVGEENPPRIPTPVFWPGEFHDCTVHGVTKSWTQLTGFHFLFMNPNYNHMYISFV